MHSGRRLNQYNEEDFPTVKQKENSPAVRLKSCSTLKGTVVRLKGLQYA